MQIIDGYEAGKAALRRVAFRTRDTGQEKTVRQVIKEVRSSRDAAVFKFTRKFDGVDLKSLKVSQGQIRKAYEQLDESTVQALNVAAEQIRTFHQHQLLHSIKEFMQGGIGQLVRPLKRIGVYVPGGTASYPSTVLMTVIPAMVAGVEDIIITTPPGKKGDIPPVILAAADIAGAGHVFKVGGAQAVAAMAYGTQSIPKVDKICGPGNVFVTLAKRMVYGDVDIDGIYGPSETVVVADDSADPTSCAADLLAQAEHDVLSTAIMITISPALASAVNKELEQQLQTLDRADIAQRAIQERGGIIIVDDMDQAIKLVNLFAPEHLSLVVRNASSYIEGIRNAGGIFIGDSSPATLGDYVAGPSHVMPTGGSARFGSPLGVNDFLKVTSVVALSDDDSQILGPAAATIARVEGLTAHARAAELRFKQGEET